MHTLRLAVWALVVEWCLHFVVWWWWMFDVWIYVGYTLIYYTTYTYTYRFHMQSSRVARVVQHDLVSTKKWNEFPHIYTRSRSTPRAARAQHSFYHPAATPHIPPAHSRAKNTQREDCIYVYTNIYMVWFFRTKVPHTTTHRPEKKPANSYQPNIPTRKKNNNINMCIK